MKVLTEYLLEIGGERLSTNRNVFIFRRYGIMVEVYVDDFLIAAKLIDNIKLLKEMIGKKFEFRDGGQIKKFLGIETSSNLLSKNVDLTIQ